MASLMLCVTQGESSTCQKSRLPPQPRGTMARRAGEEPTAAARTRSARGAVAAAPHTPCEGMAGRRFIGARGAAALRRYKYTAVDRSMIAPYLQPFWTRFVQLVPLWLAPNCITAGGLALVVLSSALAWLVSPTLDAPMPTAVILAHAGLLFAYQTLDAVDGKQARLRGRRTRYLGGWRLQPAGGAAARSASRRALDRASWPRAPRRLTRQPAPRAGAPHGLFWAAGCVRAAAAALYPCRASCAARCTQAAA
jgi:hypothetical protein